MNKILTGLIGGTIILGAFSTLSYNKAFASNNDRNSSVNAVTLERENTNFQLLANNNYRVPGEVARVYELTNMERARYGLPPLQFNYNLYVAAQNYSQTMARFNCYSHNCGSSMGDRARQAGYSYRYLGENIDKGYRTPEETVRRWMNSPGHRQNILNPNYTEFGGGYYNGYWTQVFGSR